jgi:dipeptidyl aminopeptidase/acylaminoacyl peptidase
MARKWPLRAGETLAASTSLTRMAATRLSSSTGVRPKLQPGHPTAATSSSPATRPAGEKRTQKYSLGGFCQPIPGGCYDHSFSPTWSPDGKVIAYDSDYGLHLTATDGSIGGQSYDRSRDALSTDVRDSSPAWSPDGTKIAFGFSQHDHWEIYVMNADGSNRVRLTREKLFAPPPPNNVSTPMAAISALCSRRPWIVYRSSTVSSPSEWFLGQGDEQ